MAIQKGILRFTGKVGTMVGRRASGGIYTVAEYQPAVSQPNTSAQLEVKAGFAIASKVASYLGLVGQQALIANGMPPTRRGALVGMVYAFCQSMPSPAVGAVLPASLPLVANPNYNVGLSPTIDQGAAPSVGDNGSIILTFDALGTECLRKVAAIIVYNSTLQTWMATSAIAEGAERKIQMTIPPQMFGDLQVYGYVMAVGRGSGVITGPAYGLGEVVGVANAYQSQGDAQLVVGDYIYTQVEGVYDEIRITPAQ